MNYHKYYCLHGMIMNRNTLQLYKFGSELGGITHWPAQCWLCCMLHSLLSFLSLSWHLMTTSFWISLDTMMHTIRYLLQLHWSYSVIHSYLQDCWPIPQNVLSWRPFPFSFPFSFSFPRSFSFSSVSAKFTCPRIRPKYTRPFSSRER